ncbi:hypothetical protein [Mangrovimonas cancribranchiae]|uniref:HPr kinase/phosphorylase C-terminal domain-containing protein n=1 Tax=Mangrovimonas cancribranchiae TaxID=3080055 RepID=A0AAU6P2G2_9FLAO
MTPPIAPSLCKRLDNTSWMLWFKTSNQYSIIDNLFKEALDSVMSSPSKALFLDTWSESLGLKEAEARWNQVISYLELCQTPQEDTDILTIKAPPEVPLQQPPIYLDIHGTTIAIETDDNKTLQTVFPALAVYQVFQPKQGATVTFSIFRKEGIMYLLKNGQLLRVVKQHAYHIIQGTFTTHILCSIAPCKLQTLLGTLHASTVVNNSGNAIALIGHSGRGKSTLTALLGQHGFEVLADDVSALDTSHNILYNPNGISIKQGAYMVLNPYYPELETTPKHLFNTQKGPIRYLHNAHSKLDKHLCQTIVLVAYNPNAEEGLLPIDKKTALETLIPESWLSASTEHAKLFMDWCAALTCYQLTYHNIETAVTALNQLR